MKNFIPLNRMAWKLIKALFLFSTAITIITTGIQLYSDYGRDVNAIQSRFAQIEQSYRDNITLNVWHTDTDTLKLLVKGIVEFPDFTYSAVHEDQGSVIAQAGVKLDEQLVHQEFPLIYMYKGSPLNIGTLEVTASMTGIYNRIIDRTGMILIGNGIKTLLVAIFLFFVINQLLTRHLATMASFASKLNFELPTDNVELDRGIFGGSPDELDQLAVSLNKMQNRLIQTFMEKEKSEENYRSILNNLTDTFYRTDAEGIITMVSPSAEHLFGYKTDELTGKHVEELYASPSQRQKFLKALNENNGEVSGYEITVRHKQDYLIWVSVSAHFYKDTHGNTLGIEGTIRDITASKEADRSLRESEERFSTIFEIPIIGAAIYSSENKKWVTINNAFCDLLGYQRNELDSMTWVELTHPEDVEENLRHFNAAGAGTDDGAYTMDKRFIHKNGNIVYVTIFVQTIFKTDGTPDYNILLAQNITERRQAENALKRSQSRLTEIFALAPEAIISVGMDMKIQMFNKGAQHIFGYDEDEILGRSMEILMPERLRHGHSKYVKEFDLSEDNRRMMDERRGLIGVRKDGSEFPASASVSKSEMEDGNIFTVMLSDITVRKRAEDALHQVHNELDQKVQQRTAELEKAKNEAQAGNKLKSQLITTMNHEIRTPLTSIVGSLRLLREGVLEPLPESSAGLVEIAWRNSDRLATLVNDILDVERVDAGAMEIHKQPINLVDIVRQSMDLNEGYGREYNVNFSIENIPSDFTILGDETRLLQVMANLLSNAAKFSPKDETVSVSIHREDNFAKVCVSDKGLGIPEDVQGSVFEKFVRGENVDNRNVGGAGLGLNISRSIIELHGGEIGFETGTHKNTTFYFTLPVLEEEGEKDILSPLKNNPLDFP